MSLPDRASAAIFSHQVAGKSPERRVRRLNRPKRPARRSAMEVGELFFARLHKFAQSTNADSATPEALRVKAAKPFFTICTTASPNCRRCFATYPAPMQYGLNFKISRLTKNSGAQFCAAQSAMLIKGGTTRLKFCPLPHRARRDAANKRRNTQTQLYEYANHKGFARRYRRYSRPIFEAAKNQHDFRKIGAPFLSVKTVAKKKSKLPNTTGRIFRVPKTILRTRQ